jgi:hypothetical protein
MNMDTVLTIALSAFVTCFIWFLFFRFKDSPPQLCAKFRLIDADDPDFVVAEVTEIGGEISSVRFGDGVRLG